MTDLDKLLRFDPLDTAERITGESTADMNSSAMALGFALASMHGDAKRKALTASDDTMLTNDLARYQRIIEAFGFEQVYSEPFQSQWGPQERLFIYAHRAGFFLHFDTYTVDGVPQVNGGKVHYQWVPAAKDNRWDFTSSGRFRELGEDQYGVWTGDHDCREALIFNLTRLQDNGEILPKWPHQERLWVCHFGDWHELEGEAFDAKTKTVDERSARRLAACPDWVREMVAA